MNDLRSLQMNMLNYLLEGDERIVGSVASTGKASKEQQLQIYKNAYSLRLQETIDTDHSQLGYYLGDELYDQAVAGYIKAHPSNYTSLRQFCDQFPGYLATIPLLKEVPVVAELARFERILMAAFDAPDSAVLSRNDIQTITEQDWPAVIFRFHPSVQLISFQWNPVEIWQALKEGVTPPQPKSQKNHWLVWRNAERLTEFRSLSTEEFELIGLIFNGSDFLTLCSFLADTNAQEDFGEVVSRYIFSWVDSQILRSF